ncbi:MAG: VOC family protein [Bryobacteraceae bacterium]|nr:VOC family protein [Bryobacteraceae bacterium]
MHQICYFEIQADDPEALARFYETAFGWRFMRVEGLPIPYWRIDTGGLQHGGLLKRPVAPPPPQCGTNAFVCTVEVADIGEASARILAAGGIEAMPRFEIPGRGWQAYFVDPSGNTFGIFQAAAAS